MDRRHFLGSPNFLVAPVCPAPITSLALGSTSSPARIAYVQFSPNPLDRAASSLVVRCAHGSDMV
jgi:hypothetical protein